MPKKENTKMEEPQITKEEVEKEFERAFNDYPDDEALKEYHNRFQKYINFKVKYPENKAGESQLLYSIKSKLAYSWQTKEEKEKHDEFNKLHVLMQDIRFF